MYDIAVVGGGIVGLATALCLSQRLPQKRILVIEKEGRWAAHQSGHNSGVIHSGIYYKPGSLKARFCLAGNRSMVEFCEEHGLEHAVCGKLIVATGEDELPLLDRLHQRGLAHGLDVSRLGAEAVREREGHVRALAGVWVPSTGLVDFKAVCQTYVALIARRGAALRLNTRLQRVIPSQDGLVLETNQGQFNTKFALNCAGLHSDHVAKMWGLKLGAKIVPFRGEYYELTPAKRHLVHAPVYPVPHPNFPFLGVHITPTVGGRVHVGPNAVLSLKREGYLKRDFSVRDAFETLSYPGFLRLASRYAKQGLQEIVRSLSKAAFVRSVQAMLPEVRAQDLVPGGAGVRAQALDVDGRLVDDFLLIEGARSLHVLNAPSPAATCSLEIGAYLAQKTRAKLGA